MSIKSRDQIGIIRVELQIYRAESQVRISMGVALIFFFYRHAYHAYARACAYMASRGSDPERKSAGKRVGQGAGDL